MKRSLLLLIFFLSASFIFAQGSSQTIKASLSWYENPTIHDPFENNPIEIYGFENAVYQKGHPTLPYFNHRFPVNSKGTLSVEIINVEYANLDKKATEDDVVLKDRLIFNTTITKDRQQYFANLQFIPIIKNGSNNFEKITNIELNVNFTPALETATRTLENTYVSKLSDGDIYKIAVSQNGVYKLSYDFLKTTLGISNIDNIDPKKIQILGNGGGMLPEMNILFRHDDLEENAIIVQGEGDGKFDSGDFILFYGEESGQWKHNSQDNYFSYEKNYYDDKNYYFIKIGPNNGKRITSQPSLSSTAFTTSTFDDFAHYEEEFRNLLHETNIAQGAGKKWYGDVFSLVKERDYNNLFTFENRVPDSEVIISSELASRSSVAGSSFKIATAGETFSKTFSSVSFSNPEGLFARENRIFNRFSLTGNTSTFDIKITYTANGNDSQGWLDFITMNARRNLTMTGNQMTFRDKNSLAHASTTYQISNANGITIWDVSNPLEAKLQETNSGNQISFGANSETLKQFIAFDANSNLFSAEAIGKIDNQNLHGLDKLDMIIVYTDEYSEPALKLRDHRAANDNLSIEAVRLDQIYNEFSSGKKDISAIRDLARMIHERTNDFKYLLLFGSGSFDFKNLANLNVDEDLGLNYNIIPAYETIETLNPLYAYPSDDFFALLSEEDGEPDLDGDMDIAVGRLPIKNLQEANAVVNKIINYDTNPATLGDWRLRLTFNADDQDGGVHSTQANKIADSVLVEHPYFNNNKIYFDAYPQVATPGGERFPEATEAINQDMFKGVLVMNYLGHGGGSGWAQERVLRRQHILDWENYDKLPLLVTATCSFTGFDEPNYVSAGELAMLNEKGGVIGLFTTVRAVFSSQNFALTRNAFQDLFDKDNGVTRTMGEVIRVAKNRQFGENTRKFALIGDPSQKLALPKHQIITTKINDHTITASSSLDTIGALQKVTIEGQIVDANGVLLNDFNGKIFPTIFDKPTEVSTLGQDADSPVQRFSLQKNIIFKGAASVTNGLWKFTFVVPKDINYTFGQGKISYYAHDEVSQDAGGFYDKIVIGGTNSNAINDDQPPVVEVFMNSENFVFGGITDENPVLLVKLSDDNGINVVGNSIGHDLTGVLDENTQNTYQLNDFYESALDDHTKGTVRYPLFNLEEGKHGIKVRAWDIANNSAEGYTEFIVAKSAEVALSHVLNYPNPFMENTSFQFEHNLADQVLDVQVRIFTVSGRLVKTIQEQVIADGNRITDVNWDGKDDFGDDIGRGVYLYKVTIGGTDNSGDQITAESEFEKLVVLK